jgi:UDP-N-acetyl-D-glucosamine dehydrogenase
MSVRLKNPGMELESRGFMRFLPGSGQCGQCIPVDPHYLSWKLKTLDYMARFIELAAEVNSRMPHYVVKKIDEALNERRSALYRGHAQHDPGLQG